MTIPDEENPHLLRCTGAEADARREILQEATNRLSDAKQLIRICGEHFSLSVTTDGAIAVINAVNRDKILAAGKK